MDDKLTRLVGAGFKLVGDWTADQNGIRFAKRESLTDGTCIYAFAADDELLYVGKTIVSLRQRMAGYRNPGPTQRTNIRLKERIRDELRAGRRIAVYALWPGDLEWGGLPIDLAAGMEAALIRDMRPLWNDRR